MVMDLLILTAEDVYPALPMAVAIEAMQIAFDQSSSGEITMPHRSSIATEHSVTLLMPAYIPGSRDLTVKLVSIYDQNINLGSAVQDAAATAFALKEARVKPSNGGKS